MSTRYEPPLCVKCREPLRLGRLGNDMSVACECWDDNTLAVYPAFLLEDSTAAYEETSVDGSTAPCFAHPERAAVAECAVCGRFACSLCSVQEGERTLCLDCFGKVEGSSDRPHNVTRWDDICIAGALLPCLLLWPTLVSAPTTVVLSIRNLRKPRTGLRPLSRTKLTLALVLALAECVGWGFVFFMAASGGPA